MKIIPTTATAADKIKWLAKQRRKSTRTSLAVALDDEARSHGYTNWKHVTVCREQQRAAPPEPRALPQPVLDLFAEEAAKQAPSDITACAFAAGLLFTMDVKDAERTRHEPDVEECEDAWTLAGPDLARRYIYAVDGPDDTPLVDELDLDELPQAVTEELVNYRFFRYTGETPTDLNDAFAHVFGRYFFHPRHVWLKGTFVDMAEVPEVKVGDQVIYQLFAQGADRVALYSAEVTGTAPAARSASGPTVFRLDITKLGRALYEARLSYHGQEVDTWVTDSIRDAVREASDLTGVAACEIAYGAVVVGTYTLDVMSNGAEAIAQRAVETTASVNRS